MQALISQIMLIEIRALGLGRETFWKTIMVKTGGKYEN